MVYMNCMHLLRENMHLPDSLASLCKTFGIGVGIGIAIEIGRITRYLRKDDINTDPDRQPFLQQLFEAANL